MGRVCMYGPCTRRQGDVPMVECPPPDGASMKEWAAAGTVEITDLDLKNLRKTIVRVAKILEAKAAVEALTDAQLRRSGEARWRWFQRSGRAECDMRKFWLSRVVCCVDHFDESDLVPDGKAVREGALPKQHGVPEVCHCLSSLILFHLNFLFSLLRCLC